MGMKENVECSVTGNDKEHFRQTVSSAMPMICCLKEQQKINFENEILDVNNLFMDLMDKN